MVKEKKWTNIHRLSVAILLLLSAVVLVAGIFIKIIFGIDISIKFGVHLYVAMVLANLILITIAMVSLFSRK